MDFSALLHFAKKKTDAAGKDGSKFYSTKYSPPKKENKDNKLLSENIQKFLKQRDEEEQLRRREEQQKAANLMAMRDQKSKNKIRKMLKVTKSANKSVLDDAKDVTNAAGVDQHDTDDYGYVSTEANAFYQKYIEKVKDVKEDKGFAPSRPQSLHDLSGTRERVKAAINRGLDETKPNSRNRVGTTGTPSKDACHVARAYTTTKTHNEADSGQREEERKRTESELKAKAKIKRPQQPPPMDFQALLRLAEKKQHEPVAMIAPEKKKEPERLLSAREKREQEERIRQREARERRERERLRELDQKSKEPPKKENANSAQRMEPNGRIPKLNNTATTTNKKPTSTVNESKAKPSSDNNRRSNPPAKEAVAMKPTKADAPLKKTPTASTMTSSSAKVSTAQPSKNPYAASNSNGQTRKFPPCDTKASNTVTKTRAFPPPDVQRSSAKKPPQKADVRGRPVAQSSDRKLQPPPTKRRYYDDDSEYDSELDDFIDDGQCEEDISSHIRDIFGYDKNKYRDFDDDDQGMESSYAQMQREEFISKKIGLQEDLEDMRMEAELKKRKKAKKRSRIMSDDEE